MQLNPRNQLRGTIKSIVRDAVNMEIVLALPNGTEIVSIVATPSGDAPGLVEGKEAVALINASDVRLEVGPTELDVGDKLVRANLIAEDDLRRALRVEKQDGESLCAALLRLGLLTEKRLLAFLSDLYETPSIDLDHTEIDLVIVRMIPAHVATRFRVVPVGRSGRILRIAMANPADFFAVDDIKFQTGHEVEVFVATEAAVRRAIDRLYDDAR